MSTTMSYCHVYLKYISKTKKIQSMQHKSILKIHRTVIQIHKIKWHIWCVLAQVQTHDSPHLMCLILATRLFDKQKKKVTLLKIDKETHGHNRVLCHCIHSNI